MYLVPGKHSLSVVNYHHILVNQNNSKIINDQILIESISVKGLES
jgi:hypothetical protein